LKSGRSPLFIFGMLILEKLTELIKPLAESEGFSIVDITSKREGGKLVLRVLADKPGGITMEECARVNSTLSELLEKEDLSDAAYLLEVSSPGLDRKLKKDSDFAWALGREVKVTTYVPIDGQNVFSGVLLGLGEGTVVLETDGVSAEIPREKIASAKLKFKG